MGRVAILLVAITSCLLAQDRIDRVEGPALVDVKITKESFRRINFERAGAPASSVATAEVAEIQRGGMPGALREGRAALLAGELQSAIPSLEAAARGEGAPDWVKEYAHYWLGQARLRGGDWSGATAEFERVLALNVESRFLPEVRIYLLDATIARGDQAAVQKQFDAFLAEVKEKELSPLYALRARRALGRSLEIKGQHAEAVREYDTAIREATTLVASAADAAKPALMRAALLAEQDRGHALIKSNRANDALSSFSGLSGKYKDVPGAQAVALTGLGAVDLAKGDADKARVRLTQVLAAHFEVSELRPRAMLLLAEAYLALGKAGEPEANRMARNYLEALVRRHPLTAEGREAAVMLSKF